MPAEVKLFDNLDEVERDAAGALDRGARPWLFDRLDWYRLVHDYTPPAGRLLVVRSRSEDARAWLFLGVKGSSGIAFTNWYNLRFGAVLHGTSTTAPPLDELVRGIRSAGVTHLFFSPIGEDDPLPQALRRSGWIISRSKSNVSWRIPTAGMSYEAYWESRPSRLRNTGKRRARTAGLEIAVHRAFDDQAWRDYETVYQGSWKPAEGSPKLMRRLAEQEGAAGTLRLGLAYLQGRPVAAQFWLVENGIAIIHKLAYTEADRQHSPGTVLSMEMFRHALDVDKVAMIDFGIGNDAYKADWMSESVPLYALTAYDLLRPRGIAGAARAAVRKLVPGALSR